MPVVIVVEIDESMLLVAGESEVLAGELAELLVGRAGWGLSCVPKFEYCIGLVHRRLYQFLLLIYFRSGDGMTHERWR